MCVAAALGHFIASRQEVRTNPNVELLNVNNLSLLLSLALCLPHTHLFMLVIIEASASVSKQGACIFGWL